MQFKILLLISFFVEVLTLQAQAQTTTTDTSKTSATTTARVFGGTAQYNTFSVGINVGATAPRVATGGVNVFNSSKVELGYGITVKDQLSHTFGVQLNLQGGKLAGSEKVTQSNPVGFVTDQTSGLTASSFSTKFMSATLSATENVGNISWLHRKSGITFYLSEGMGLAWYTPTVTLTDGTVIAWKGQSGPDHNHTYVHELVVPVGAGVKFQLTDQLDLNLGYTENFVDGFNLTGVHAAFPAQNKYSYGYAGLEYTLGSKSKQSLEWVNPVAMMYDELYDAALRAEVEALKGRVANVETAVNDLKKDSDGDGVSDRFDKCPNTPAGTVVDGSGCPLVIPPPFDTSLFVMKAMTAAPPTAAYANIQFDRDRSTLKPSSYPGLDATSADLRSSGASVELDGFDSSEGSDIHSRRLARARANSVKTYLVNSGVPANKIKVKAFGETHPIADNSTEAGRIMNRRVEFKILNSNQAIVNLIKFDPGQFSPVLNPKDLDNLVTYLINNPNSTVTLTGHCSSREPVEGKITLKNDPYKNLSKARLKTVVNYLVIKHINLNRIKQISAGKDHPYNDDDGTIPGHLDNHSVEISMK